MSTRVLVVYLPIGQTSQAATWMEMSAWVGRDAWATILGCCVSPVTEERDQART